MTKDERTLVFVCRHIDGRIHLIGSNGKNIIAKSPKQAALVLADFALVFKLGVMDRENYTVPCYIAVSEPEEGILLIETYRKDQPAHIGVYPMNEAPPFFDDSNMLIDFNALSEFAIQHANNTSAHQGGIKL